jgi:hypothetical protein
MDYNLLKSNSYQFSIERIPETIFRITAVNLPEISVPAPSVPSGASTQYFPGSTSEFSQLTISFLVDENLNNYEEIFRWITQQRFEIGSESTPKNITETKLTSDATLLTLTNSSNPNRMIKFFDLFPTSLGQLNFSTQQPDPIPVECSAQFYFSRFVFM